MGRAAEMRKRGKTYMEIANELQCSFEAVRRRLVLANDRGDLYPRSPPGRTPMSERTKRCIYIKLLRHPHRSFADIGREFALSATTIRIVARSHLLYRFIMKRKPLLTLPARCQRLKWASEVIHQDWSSVVFTDEALVTIRDQGRR
jgi:uncharacterized protein YerC